MIWLTMWLVLLFVAAAATIVIVLVGLLVEVDVLLLWFCWEEKGRKGRTNIKQPDNQDYKKQ